MIIYISEIIGTFIFIFMSLAVISNAISLGSNNNVTLMVTSIGVGLAYILPCILFGDISGAHFNPAITIATAYIGIFPKKFMWGYIISETAGSFGAALLYVILFSDKLKKCYDNISKSKIFSVYPECNFFVAFLKEVLASFLLLIGMLGVEFVLKGVTTESIYVLYFLVIVSIGFAFDYTTVAVNPFRDIWTRFFYLILPFKNKGKIKFYHILITIFAPIIGTILAVLFFKTMKWSY